MESVNNLALELQMMTDPVRGALDDEACPPHIVTVRCIKCGEHIPLEAINAVQRQEGAQEAP